LPPNEEKTQTVRVTGVSGTEAVPHVQQYVEVDGITGKVGQEMDLTEDQIKRLKKSGVSFDDDVGRPPGHSFGKPHETTPGGES